MNFSQMILTMQEFWAEQGCSILQPIDMEVGAGTYHPATIFGILDNPNQKVVYVQPSRRPQDGRAGKNPNRLYMHHQLQVVIQSVPENIQDLVSECFKRVGITGEDYDLRYVEDNWKSPGLGAAGFGWEVRCNELEVLQYTYFQQMGGYALKNIPVELAYGLERLAMRVQKKESIYDLMWNDTQTYAQVRLEEERQMSEATYALDTELLTAQFKTHEEAYSKLMEKELFLAAYQECLRMSHIFNNMDAIGLGYIQRETYIKKIRGYSRNCIRLHMEKNNLIA